jgi:hypothetical protein
VARFAGAGDNFSGTARKAAKLSISDAQPEDFQDLQALIASLPDEDTMMNHDPEITTAANSGRVAEEERNIRVKAFIYAASREADNDFHLILGRDPKADPLYMTMEVSGLPPAGSPSLERLTAARNAYKQFFGQNLPGPTYDFYDPPIPVEMEGSPFFDMTHAQSPPASRPGPHSLKDHMPVIWEVHPVSRITFEP